MKVEEAVLGSPSLISLMVSHIGFTGDRDHRTATSTFTQLLSSAALH